MKNSLSVHPGLKTLISESKYLEVTQAFCARYTGVKEEGAKTMSSEINMLKVYWTQGRYDVVQRAFEVMEYKFLPTEPFYEMNLCHDDMSFYRSKLYLDDIEVKESGDRVSITVTLGSVY